MPTCEFRSVDKDGRIICKKITEGDNEVSPNLCRECPARKANCTHLTFSLLKTVPSPIVVRYATGRVEVWNDDPPALHFRRAACALHVVPIQSPVQCLACSARVCRVPVEPQPVPAQAGKVVHFPSPAAVAS